MNESEAATASATTAQGKTDPEAAPSRSTAARIRLALATLAFLAWIGWLAYLAATTTRPIVLSRPQLLVSEIDVLANLTERDGQPDPIVQVTEVLWTRHGKVNLPEGIKVVNLSSLTSKDGWVGPGEYILPLIRMDENSYRVAPIPDSPGFVNHLDRKPIYRYSDRTLEQFRDIRKVHNHG